MLQWLTSLLNTESLSPHGICLLWRPELIWTHMISDFLIGGAYFSIPVFLGYLATKRPDVSFNWMMWAFAAFILACGTTHFFSIWTLWIPDYGLEAIIKAATALVSVGTAVALWFLIPRAMAWPSPQQLLQANTDLTIALQQRDDAMRALLEEVAERKRAEEMLVQAQKMEALGRLTGGIAHDFNNLLTVILMSVERASKDVKSGAAAKGIQNMERALVATRRASKLTGQLAAVGRQHHERIETIDVGEALRIVADLFRLSLKEDQVFSVQIEEGLPYIAADRNQLEAAVLNLLVNAHDAVENGGQITLRAIKGRGNNTDAVVVEVNDTGIGMTDEVRRRAFDPFFTTKELGKGTGLGLSQVYGFVQRCDGEVTVESGPGLGARVAMTLPAKPASEA
jgi:signal transduction histidine kinase